MDATFEFLPEVESRTVYIRSVLPEELPEEMRPQVEGMDRLYSVHHEDGECLAVVHGRRLAFALARQHDLTPVAVH
ncbi:DUF1150 domain-containing protein [Aliiroseovarius crassostreae]|uniref:DUF1150 domain-containing protein n=1 Tax=Aliiroseovarius crassostreae TaxID=154981 RepID=UPI0021FC38E1|nr:DUF1150 domain-containing protein [Aliiroseovarius crassostreae]UWQ03871.1 DUF1150 domain-containing protein [Aliiroseovarius crassostreae]UWQ08640.1 DUF1150 domain-containing protein [Aliiroseovarius crassostreae]